MITAPHDQVDLPGAGAGHAHRCNDSGGQRRAGSDWSGNKWLAYRLDKAALVDAKGNVLYFDTSSEAIDALKTDLMSVSQYLRWKRVPGQNPDCK